MNLYSVCSYRPRADRSPGLVYYSGSNPPTRIKGADRVAVEDYQIAHRESNQIAHKESNQIANKQSNNIQLRGLINLGNLCFANSIFQSLVFCQPFYQMMIGLSTQLPFSFNKTPLLDATIAFLQQFNPTNDMNDMNDIGEPFTPTLIYDALKQYNRFNTIHRGQQEDAEEFLGFFLDTLHEELVSISPRLKPRTRWFDGVDSPDDSNEWLQVGHKNKTLNKPSTPSNPTESPISKLFGGKFRSTLKTPGQKDSITLEPFQPLQLDIQPDHIHSIEDALLNLAQPETIHGVYSPSKQGPVDATKQVTIDTSPPILIIHLKRFLYHSVGGVMKSNKRITYQPTLSIPNSILSPWNTPADGLHYRLFAVVYHHGQNSGSGHYTIDVLRQDLKQWVHIDDIVMNFLDENHVVETEYGSSGNNNSNGSSANNDKTAYLLLYSKM
ncbi:putative ubiquitin carboxyl-terminal hydrolase 3 [Wallemia ichthyophaga EXF-994]|uniref:Ubiquitin carboxyl-terminal hydrolase n=1 Tax=Wallemia ichthyophaga (strain EXF-994 / CBS 113033) TaxID=1299270 RepID=R9ABT6_WALI9|nr:putative ubiquitin carboxyl-terminal hydrolase 3 [Wallemia ichthyophaga EXF-994]EOQ99539.1 putative ubiquitin carboxyl-terminal hydrolase 3 [Wallemia ichthyophaga EXF-994]